MNRGTYTIEKIALIIGADLDQLTNPTYQVNTICYDSRKITDQAHAIFFALTGRRDGHHYIADAYKAGVRNFVVKNNTLRLNQFAGSNILRVENPLMALQQLAAHHRRQFTYPVIAITGSNGKTIVKEWLYQLLSPEYNIIRSPKSYNSQLGVPLSLWQMDDRYNLAIIEAGISKAGEMEAIEAMVKPTIGVFTNLGHAHDDGFTSMEQKAAEKLKLFKNAALVVYSPSYLSGIIPGKETFSWQIGDGSADLTIIDCTKVNNHTSLLKARYRDETIELAIPFVDKAAIENITCCCAAMLALGYHTQTIAGRIQHLFPVSMRLELKKGINNCSIIDDSYSNDLSSLTIALDFLKQQQQHTIKVLILSDIPVEDTYKVEVYKQLAKLLQDKQIIQLIGVGKHIQQVAGLLKTDTLFFDNTEQLLTALPALGFNNSTILIKGARVFGFERVSRMLTLQTHETTLEINLNAVEHNLNVYKSLLKQDTKLMVMVKAFSYGSGSYEIANLLQFNKVDYLTVAYADEGITLRNNGIQLPIVVMSPGTDTFEQLIQHQLEPEIYSFSELKILINLLETLGKEAFPVHIKVDTGMHRLGFEPEELSDLLEVLGKTKAVKVASVFSHLAASGDKKFDAFTQEQIRLFGTFATDLRKGISYDFIKHIANSAAIVRFPDAQFDMVRLGIGLYGIGSDVEQGLFLQPVASLKTGITQIKKIKSGETVGYNRKGKLNRDGTIATVKLGYADGYNRRFGNGVGKMIVNGQTAPVVGDICMDMCMLDITGIDAREGDEVLVMGQEMPVEQLAETIGTIPYEILTGISQRVRRIYYYE